MRQLTKRQSAQTCGLIQAAISGLQIESSEAMNRHGTESPVSYWLDVAVERLSDLIDELEAEQRQ